MIANSVVIAIFICLSAFFSASETAIFSLSPARLHRLQGRHKRAKKLTHLLKKPSLLLSTIVFGNMLVNIGLSAFSTALFVRLFAEKGAAIAIIFSGSIILFLGEVFPKTFAIYAAERVSLFAAPLLAIFSKAFRPFIYILKKVSDGISFSLIRRKKKSTAFTEAELKTVLLLGRKEGVITKAEEEMVSYVLKFKETSVDQIMTPRVEVAAVSSNSSRDEIVAMLKEKRHSKFPVYEETLDNVKGILYSKDVFLNPDTSWGTLLREPLFIPESKKIDSLLSVFIKNHEHIAVVIDEYGGTAGIVTFEDVVEEIFGELYDEYESPQKLVQKMGDKTYRAFGKTPLKVLNLEVGLNLSEEEGTLAGFLLAHLERIPKLNDTFVFEGIEFTVEGASRKRLTSIILKVL